MRMPRLPRKSLILPLERDAIRAVTPGTVIEPSLLDSRSNNYLAGLVIDGEEAGIAYVDITTGEFAITQLPAGQISSELEHLQPVEVLIPQSAESSNSVSPAGIAWNFFRVVVGQPLLVLLFPSLI